MHILHIDSSPRRESHSRELSAAIVEKLLEVAPGASISRRDLGTEPLPHTVADYAAALASPATLAAPPKGSLDVSEALIQEVEAADVIVIGTPMHNYTIPSVLKAWIDQILRVGRTMKSTPTGKVGMLRDRPVFIGVASGGIFTGDRANFLDHDQAALAREKALAAIDLMGKLRGVDGRPAVLSGTGRLYREAHRLLRGASHREFPKGAPRALGTPSP